MYAVGLIFVRFDLFFAVLILNERVSLYLCTFNIGRTRFEDFNETLLLCRLIY